MENTFKVTVSVQDETWEFYNLNGQTGGSTKRDKEYLQEVINVLEVALVQAKGQVGAIS